MGLCLSEFPFNSFPSYPLAPISKNSVWKSLVLLNSWRLKLALPVVKLVHALRIHVCRGWTERMTPWIFRKPELGEKKIHKGQEGFLS